LSVGVPTSTDSPPTVVTWLPGAEGSFQSIATPTPAVFVLQSDACTVQAHVPETLTVVLPSPPNETDAEADVTCAGPADAGPFAGTGPGWLPGPGLPVGRAAGAGADPNAASATRNAAHAATGALVRMVTDRTPAGVTPDIGHLSSDDL
jgi:hypothetical protein